MEARWVQIVVGILMGLVLAPLVLPVMCLFVLGWIVVAMLLGMLSMCTLLVPGPAHEELQKVVDYMVNEGPPFDRVRFPWEIEKGSD